MQGCFSILEGLGQVQDLRRIKEKEEVLTAGYLVCMNH